MDTTHVDAKELCVRSVHIMADGTLEDFHAIRIVYDGWVPHDAPEPQTMEVDGSTAEAAWLPLSAVTSGEIPTSPLVTDALEVHKPSRMQRLAAYALGGNTWAAYQCYGDPDWQFRWETADAQRPVEAIIHHHGPGDASTQSGAAAMLPSETSSSQIRVRVSARPR